MTAAENSCYRSDDVVCMCPDEEKYYSCKSTYKQDRPARQSRSELISIFLMLRWVIEFMTVTEVERFARKRGSSWGMPSSTPLQVDTVCCQNRVSGTFCTSAGKCTPTKISRPVLGLELKICQGTREHKITKRTKWRTIHINGTSSLPTLTRDPECSIRKAKRKVNSR